MACFLLSCHAAPRLTTVYCARPPADGQLRQVDAETGITGEQPYNFAHRPDDAAYNQRRYEALGDVITEHVYDLLLAAGLQRIAVPTDVPAAEATFVFASRPDFAASTKLLLLINGSGAVRAGQWARSLIINQSLDHGSQLPYIRRALSLGYDVLVLNTNDNQRDGRAIAQCRDAEAHAAYVWQLLVAPSPARVAIVAHSYGGVVTMRLARRYAQHFGERVFAVALTDSVHSDIGDGQLMERIARNWVSSGRPLNELVRRRRGSVAQYSAGHAKHEWTSWACIEPVFEFVEERYRAVGVADAVPVVEAGAAADRAERLAAEEEAEAAASASKKPRTDL